MGGMPGLSAVDADPDLVDGARTAPGIAADHMNAGRHRLDVVVGLGDDRLHADRGDQLLVGVVGRSAVVVELVVVPAVRLALHELQLGQPLHRPVARPARHQQPHRGAVEMLQQLAVLRPGQNGVGVERLFDRQTLVVVEGFGALGGGRRHPQIAASARTWRELAVRPASRSTAASGTPVHSLALRIIASWVRDGFGPSPFKYSKKVASLPEHSMTVRTLRPGKRRNWSKLRVSGFLTSPKMFNSQQSVSTTGGTAKCWTV